MESPATKAKVWFLLMEMQKVLYKPISLPAHSQIYSPQIYS